MKKALCIGNNNYENLSPLKGCENDAKEMNIALSEVGFKTEFFLNLNRQELIKIISKFSNEIKDNDFIVFYYSGHGFQINNENYIIPINFDANSDSKEAKYECYPLNDLIKNLTEHKNISLVVILDACRGEFSDKCISSKTFAAMSAPLGSLIAFSTSPGTAAKEIENHGLYTYYLLKNIRLPRIPVERVFKKTREDILNAKEFYQIPWEHTSLIGNLYFNADDVAGSQYYEEKALANRDYICKSNDIRNIISGLKSYNWSMQEVAISNLFSISLMESSVNDLFIVGRNLYQAACGNSFAAIGTIERFGTNKLDISVKQHIINGMAFEILFDSYGKPRKEFKDRLYKPIIELLEDDNFINCRSFIIKRINQYVEDLIYIPGSSDIIDIKIILQKISNNEYEVKDIMHQGKSVYYMLDSINIDSLDIDSLLTNSLYIEQFENMLYYKTLSPSSMMNIDFNIDINSNDKIRIAKHFRLVYNFMSKIMD